MRVNDEKYHSSESIIASKLDLGHSGGYRTAESSGTWRLCQPNVASILVATNDRTAEFSWIGLALAGSAPLDVQAFFSKEE